MWIDPPNGWRYGFPKTYSNPENKPIEQWLRENGYPQKELDWGAAKYCRFGGGLSGCSKEDLEKLAIHYEDEIAQNQRASEFIP